MIPERIGPYRTLGTIGLGGFATVLRGEHLLLGEIRAVKLLFEHLVHDEDTVMRFLDEARKLCKIRSERIVQVYEVDQLENGQPWFAMELADLGTLHDRMKAKKMSGGYSIEEALKVAIEIAECLTEVHDRELVHRDITPKNLLYKTVIDYKKRESVEARGNGSIPLGRLILGDFGISRRFDATLTHSVGLGTPAYMAPEVADIRRSEPIGYKADIYSAGVVLYELLTGQLPFEPYWNGIRWIPRGEEAPTPLRAIRPEIPAELGQLVERALSFRPQERFADAWEWGGFLRQRLFDVQEGGVGARTTKPVQPPPLLQSLGDFCDLAIAAAKDHAPAREQFAAIREHLFRQVVVVVVASCLDEANATARALEAANTRRSFRFVPAGMGTTEDKNTVRQGDVFCVLLPADVNAGRQLLRALRRLVRERLSPASALGVVWASDWGLDREAVKANYESYQDVRSTLAELLAPPGPLSVRGTVGVIAEALVRLFSGSEHLLKASSVLAQLQPALRGAELQNVESLRDELERLRLLAPELDELRVLSEERTGILDLPSTLREDLRRVLSEPELARRVGLPENASTEVVRDAASRGAARWRSFINSGRASQRSAQASQVVARTYERLWDRMA